MQDLAPFYRGRRVIVTGGAGFIGSNLVRQLVRLEAAVTVIDALLPDYGGNLFNLHGVADRVTLHRVDVRDEAAMSPLVEAGELMFNLAGQISHIDSMRDPQTDLDINTRSQLSLLQACRARNPGIKIVYAGTRQVYGKPRFLPVTEDHPLKPVDVNGINKLAGERYHVLYHEVYGIRSVVLRLTNTYGPRQLVRHDRQGFMGWFIRRIVAGGEIQLFGDGGQRRDLNFVDDVVEALLRAGATPACDGEIFNLGHPDPVSLREIVELMIELRGAGSYRLVPFPPDRGKIDIGDYYSSFARFNRVTGWQPQVDLRRGLGLTLDYYREHGEHYF